MEEKEVKNLEEVVGLIRGEMTAQEKSIRGMTITLHMNEGTVGRWLKMNRQMTMEGMFKILDYLGYDVKIVKRGKHVRR